MRASVHAKNFNKVLSLTCCGKPKFTSENIQRKISSGFAKFVKMASGGKNGKNSRTVPQYMDLDGSASLEEAVNVPVSGQLPKWLKGSLYRNGSGVYHMGGKWLNHAFDGFAVLHRWTIKDGAVSYLSTVLDSEDYMKCVKYNRLVGNSFGTSFPDPCKSVFWRFFTYFCPKPPPTSDNTAVSIVEFGDRLFALTESTLINEVKPETMKKKSKIDISKTIAVHMGTAHPHMEKDGTMYYFGTKMAHAEAYQFIHVPPDSASPFKGAKVVAVVPSRLKRNISYTHSFGMTKNYFVHLEQPFTINMYKLLTQHWRETSIAGSINCHKDMPIDIHIIHKTTGKRVPITYKAPYGFVFHFVNCYEDSGYIVCDVALYEKGDIIHDLTVKLVCSDDFDKAPVPVFARYILPLSVEGAKEGENLVKLPGTKATATLAKGTKNVLNVTCDKMFGDAMFELPRINYAYNAQEYRYTYGSTVYRRSERMLMKLDLREKKRQVWTAEATHAVGEPVFVPSPEATKEDDGVVLCPILANSTKDSSFLLVLDAPSFKEIARATTPANLKMNVTFHGSFVKRVF